MTRDPTSSALAATRGELERALAESGGQLVDCMKVALAFLPLVGGPAIEMLNIAQKADAERKLLRLVAELDSLSKKIEMRAGTREFLESEDGRTHILSIVEQATCARGDRHVEALASAYASGAGLGCAPQQYLVQVLDDTLRSLGQPHIALLRYAVTKQGGKSLRQRLTDPVDIKDVAIDVGAHNAIVQKLANDLVQHGAAKDANLGRTGGHWGLRRFSLTGFGLLLCNYVSAPDVFHTEAPVAIESALSEDNGARPEELG